MKSGKKKKLIQFKGSTKFNLNDYEHSESGCKGRFGIEIQQNSVFNFDILGPVRLPLLPLVSCETCKATYELEDYMETTELFVSFLLLQNQKLLTKKQLKFLRVLFDKSQGDIAQLLRVDRSHYSKMESEKTSVFMQPDQQVRVKIYYLHELEEKIGIPKDVFADVVVKINAIDESGMPVVDSDLLAKQMESINENLRQAFR
ncbi:MAG: helix-turn-helix transcriptional regulator [Deltaproteobacteria bacterium]|nr:helix-turn-helix transcriptional regulator [Deltaproteobacteria bacterium]